MITRDGLRRTLLVAVPVLVVLAPLAASVWGYATGGRRAGVEPFLELPVDRTQGCVRDVEYMRFHHWELLRRVRDEAVRDGARGEISLDRCRQCHPDRARFCNQCHQATSLEPDCFGCHWYPESPTAAADRADGGGEVTGSWNGESS